MDPSACSERSRWAGLAVLAAAALAAAALIAPPAASAGVAAKPKPLPNLLVNPGAENGVPVPVVKNYRAFTTRGWTPMGYEAGGVVEVPPDAFPYATTYNGGLGGGLTKESKGPKGGTRGARYFFGGSSNTTATLTQSVSLAKYASTVDAGKATFALSGWLGGYADQADAVTVTATFLDANGTPVGTPAAIGPVTPAMRGNQTKLMLRSTTGPVPAQARSATVQMLFGVRTGGTTNDGYADNLKFGVIASR
ncbi:MAG: hypothetical protein IPO93_11460 [Actinobacteria bacterium]|nr:hypothetical protein [Actinomycetota bacterium]